MKTSTENQAQDQIYSTTDYDQFKFLEANRTVNPRHLAELIGKIREKNLLKDLPIIVNDKMEVMDGQHRLNAARELAVPIYYKISNEFVPEDIASVNSSGRGWILQDYLDFHIAQNNANYIKLNKFVMENNINLYTAIGLLSGASAQPGSVLIKDFENGKFTYKNEQHAKKVLKMRDDFKNYFTAANSKMFLNALSRISKNEKYDHKRMIEKLNYNWQKLTKAADVNSYVKMLEQIFNFKARKHDLVHFS